MAATGNSEIGCIRGIIPPMATPFTKSRLFIASPTWFVIGQERGYHAKSKNRRLSEIILWNLIP